MEKRTFTPQNIYYLKIEEHQNIEDIILDQKNHSKLIDLNLESDENIQNIKNKLEEILGEELHYGNACLDFLEKQTEDQLLNTSFYDLVGKYDYDVFKNIVLVTGEEMNNI